MAIYPVQPGTPDYSSTGLSPYTPAIYSALLIKKFYPETICAKISQTDYEGEIKGQGDTVNIRTRATVETGPYKAGMVLPIQTPTSPLVTLKINQGEYYSVALDRVQEHQADIKLINIWGEDAAKQMAQAIDRNVLTALAAAGATAGGQLATTISGYNSSVTPTMDQFTKANGALVAGGTTVRGTSISTDLAISSTAVSMNEGNKITSRILKFARYLNENNAPQEGRFVVVPFWVQEVLLTMASTNLFGQAYATGQNQAGILSNNVPRIAGFDIMFSNNLPLTTESAANATTPVLFGCKYATTFASQITESRIIENPYAWGKMMQGLQVYGFNIIKPQLFGVDFWKNAA